MNLAFISSTRSSDLNFYCYRFKENFVLRQFYDIDVDMEFRGFVFDGRLTALSQYNYLIHSQRLNENKNKISRLIEDYYVHEVGKKLTSENYLPNFIIDFAVFSSNYLNYFI